jgi:hypothetical protein
MNNLNEQQNILNPSQPVIPFTAEDLQANINARKENARIRRQLSRSSQSSAKIQAVKDSNALSHRKKISNY